MAEWEEHRWSTWYTLYKGTEVGERHEAALSRLRKSLAKIPASLLTDASGQTE